MVEVGKVTAVLDVDDGKLKSGLRSAHNDVQNWATNASKAGQISLGAISGVAMAGGMMAVQALMQAANAIGPAAAMSWEKGMGTAIKTIGIDKFDPGTGRMSAAYKTLNADLLDLRANLRGASQEAIYGTASSLGSLGIAQDQIKGSTQVVLQNAAAFGMSSEDTSTKLAQVNTLWKEQSDQMGGATVLFQKTGSAVNELGNAYSATESNVLSFLSEAGGTAGVWDRSIADTAAFGAMLETMGMKGPEAATGLRSALNEGLFAAGIETSKVPKGYKLAAQMLGIGDSQIKDSLNKDLYGTLIDIASAVDKKFGSDSSAKSQAFKNIFGGYGVELGTKLAGKGDLFKEMLGTANEGFEDGTSAQAEYERQTDNLSGALDELKGAFDVLSITAWSSSLGPAQGIVEDVAEAVRGLTTALATGDWSQFNAAIDTMQQKLMDFVYGIDYSGIGNDILTAIVDSLESVDYDAIGYQLLDILKGAWSLAVGGFSGDDTRLSDILAKPFTALKAVIGPTVDHVHDVFVLKMAGIIGAATVAGTQLADGLVGGIQSAYVTIINYLNEIYTKITGIPAVHIGVSGAGGASDTPSWVVPGGTYQRRGSTSTRSGASIPSDANQGDWIRLSSEKTQQQQIDDATTKLKIQAALAGYGAGDVNIVVAPAQGSLQEISTTNLLDEFWRESKKEGEWLWNTAGEVGHELQQPVHETDLPGFAQGYGLGAAPGERALDAPVLDAIIGTTKTVTKPIVDTISDGLEKGLDWRPHTEEELATIRQKAEADAIALMGGLHSKPEPEPEPDEEEVESPLPVVDTAVADALKAKADEANRLAAEAAALAAAAREAAVTLVGGSQTAANAIQLGGQVSANFSTQGGQAVKIGLDAAGREIAVIGQVAQKQWEESGNQLYTKVQVAGSDLQEKSGVGGTALSNGGKQGGAAVLDGCEVGASALAGAASGLVASSNAFWADLQRKYASSGAGAPSFAGDMDQLTRSSYDTSEALSHTAESMDTWCEAASDFAQWQETTAGLFQKSYIGPTAYYLGNSGGSYGSSGGSYGGWNPSMYQGGQGVGYLDYQGYQLPPIFMASEAFVSSPTLAVVGDRPGGEYVIGAARFENAVSKMGGGGVTVNITQNINGSGLSASELSDVLERNNRELVDSITSQMSEAARG